MGMGTIYLYIYIFIYKCGSHIMNAAQLELIPQILRKHTCACMHSEAILTQACMSSRSSWVVLPAAALCVFSFLDGSEGLRKPCC